MSIGLATRGYMGGGAAAGTPVLTVLTTFSASFKTARLTTWQGEIADFPDDAELVVLVKYSERNEMIVARDAEGVWHWPFDVEPENAADTAADPVTLQLFPRGGWPPCDVEIQCLAATLAEEA